MTASPTETRRPRLIEVAFPLEEVSAHSRRDKNIRHGHISTLHIWWARRPLAACRAFLYASLVDAPDDPAELDALLREVADIASWDVVSKPDTVVRAKADGGSGLTGRELLERARKRIRRDNDGRAPRLLDPFAGGGAIPLEGLRLGCAVEASDLNPVAVLIEKGTLEYPQHWGRPLEEQRAARQRGEREAAAGVDGAVPPYVRDGDGGQRTFAADRAAEAYERNPLAADVRWWGGWVLERARADLAPFYPADADGSVPVAYLWSRTVPCPNCGGEMPLIRQYWLARKDRKKVALQPVVDRAARTVDFTIVEGADIQGDASEATTSRGDTRCLLCHQVVKADEIQKAGMAGQMGQMATAVVLEATGAGGKTYRAARAEDRALLDLASSALAARDGVELSGFPAVPDEPLANDPRNIWCTKYGLDTFGKLFNDRQLLALTTFARLVPEAHAAMLARGLDPAYAKAVATYLGFAVDRLADRGSVLARWDNAYTKIANTFTRQALPMVWDYAEVNPFSGSTGDFASATEWIVKFIAQESFAAPSSRVALVDARRARKSVDIVLTDPPYYDAINYGDLSDFFYVWLKRTLGDIHPDVLSVPLTPKKPQIVMNTYAEHTKGKDAAREHYVRGMAEAFGAMAASLEPDGMVGVVFAHTAPDAWATLLEGLLGAGLSPNASWPIDTELENKASGLGQARLKTSVWMACRPRPADAGDAFLEDVVDELRREIRHRLLDFWQRGIRGADFFISAIGPGLAVYGRHRRMLRPDGSVVTVRDFLDLVRREATAVALEQVLRGASLGQIDPLSRLYLTWVWSYGKAALETGEALALGLATGTDYGQAVQPGSIAREVREGSKKLARLRSVAERAREDEALGQSTGARQAPVVDRLQHAALLWSQNRAADAAAYRAELGEPAWQAVRALGQAVAECLPEGDEDRRVILGLLGSAAGSAAAPRPPVAAGSAAAEPRTASLPGFDEA